MSEHQQPNHRSLDSLAFAVVLSAMFVCTILGFAGSMTAEMPAAPVAAIAAAPSQLQCARL